MVQNRKVILHYSQGAKFGIYALSRSHHGTLFQGPKLGLGFHILLSWFDNLIETYALHWEIELSLEGQESALKFYGDLRKLKTITVLSFQNSALP